MDRNDIIEEVIEIDDNQRVEEEASPSDYLGLSSDEDEDIEEDVEEDEEEDEDEEDEEDYFELDEYEIGTYIYTEKDFKEDTDFASSGNNDAKKYCQRVSLRANILLFFIFVIFVVVLIKIFALQLNSDSADMRRAAKDANYELFDVPAKRGDILSINRDVISSSVKMYKVFMDLRVKQLSDEKFENEYRALADSLSNMFKDASAAIYCERLLKWREGNFAHKLVSPVGRLIDYNELERMKTFPILNGHPNNGGAKEELLYERKNYYGSLARKVIGNQKTKNNNGSGIELNFDNYLKGVDGKDYRRKVSGSLWEPVESPDNMEAQDGYDVVSTIDVDIQDIATASLYKMIDENQADWGTAVVMEVESGEIRAMANIGRDKETRELGEIYNYAVATGVEPGSTYKLIPLLALLEQKSVRLDTIINTGKGVDYINRTRVSDSHGYGKIPFKTCMSKSSNIGFARIVDDYYRDTPQAFVDFLVGLGITDDINFQLEGEAKPKFRDTRDELWSKSDLVAMSYGYATQFTALRILMLYNAIANNGKLITPIVVKEILNNGEPVETFEANVVNDKICSDRTLENVRVALEDVMYDGTVRSVFKNESYVVAGKTGTSRQVGKNSKYEQDNGINYLASFVGYFPANNPKYTCIVQIKTFKPKRVDRKYYGAGLAAPVFRDISHYISTKSDWGKSASNYAAEKETQFISEWKKVDAMQGIKKKSSDYYQHDNDRNSANGKLSVSGDYYVVENLKYHFNLDNYELVNQQNMTALEMNTMPNVVGMGLDDVLFTLESLGLEVTIKGRGRVKSQSIKAGATLREGDRVLIVLEI